VSTADPTATGPKDALRDLAARLREEGSVISPHVRPAVEPAALGDLAASGPRTSVRAQAYAGVVELVREGYLLHYETPRLVDPPDQDLALLAGDYLYALGLEQLAALGDLAAVSELSDLISLVAQVHAAEGRSGRARRASANALWLAAATAIAAEPSEGYRSGKDLVRGGGSARPLHDATVAAAAEAGIAERLSVAAEAIGFSPSDLG
jgi:hypothetical protein